MSQPVLTAQDLIAWLEKTSTGWRELLLEHPELLAMPATLWESRQSPDSSSTS
jgi:hypothetical protein